MAEIRPTPSAPCEREGAGGNVSGSLVALAERVGILPNYIDALEGRRRETTVETRRALLAAMGFDVQNDKEAWLALGDLERRRRDQIVRPVQVVRGTRGRGVYITLHFPVDQSRPSRWRSELCQEDGTTFHWEGHIESDARASSVRIRLPKTPCLGYHRLTVNLRGSGWERSAEQLLVMCPLRCFSVSDLLGDAQAAGICANLYTVRSGSNWGVGDLTDLARLCEWAGGLDVDFIGVNPLHVHRNLAGDCSPYSPVSRLFRNPIYLDVTAIPEFAECAEAQRMVASSTYRADLSAMRSAEHVDYDRIMTLKQSVLEPLYRRFEERHLGAKTARGRAFAAYVEAEGEQLDLFATHRALEAHLADREGRDWRRWPAAFQDANSPVVDQFRREHAGEVNFHRYLQFEIDRQLAAAAQAARASGMRIGLYQDLPLGASIAGSDAWAHPDLFVQKANLGAPPDDYSRVGQDWGLPPLDPVALAADRYQYWRGVLRGAFRHSGAIRLDHVMGLTRQFWVPQGAAATEGAYVRYPTEDLVGILALESVRHRALVIGEDLGTVPRGFSARLARWGILSCRVLYFQRDRRGGFLASSRYPRRALVTSSTHDHVPLAGFWRGTDLDLRRRLGHIESDASLDTAVTDRQKAKAALVHRLTTERLLSKGGRATGNWSVRRADPTGVSFEALCRAVHAFLGKTPSRLVGLMLDDLAGEAEPVNMPGLSQDEHPSWSRRMRRTLEELEADEAVRESIVAATERMERTTCRRG